MGAMPTIRLHEQTQHTRTDMKTHLPVALRKALLAALVAVSYVNYSPACAVELATGDINVVVMNNNTSDKTLRTGNGDVAIGQFSM